MDISFTNLKKVPAISKQELLVYIAAMEEPVSIKITTRAGFFYYGQVINVFNIRDDGAILLLQVNEKNDTTGSILHIAVANIESVEIAGGQQAAGILSQGKMFAGPSYTLSGKLELQRAFKSFADNIYAATAVQTGIPVMELPADGLALNRILRLTETIQAVITDVLQEEDARKSWLAKYSQISFIDSDALDVSGTSPILSVHFAFSNINAAEISGTALTDKLLAVL